MIAGALMAALTIVCAASSLHIKMSRPVMVGQQQR